MNPLWNELPELREIAARLRAVHRRWLLLSAGRVALSVIGIVCALFWALVLVEHLWGLSVAARYTIWAIAALVAAVGLVAFLNRWFGAVPLRERALDLERYAPELREQLVTAVEMADSDELRRLGYSPLLYNHTVRIARAALDKIDLGGFWRRARVQHGLRVLGIGVVATLILSFIFPAPAGRTLLALANPSLELLRPVPFTWHSDPGDKRVMQYDDVELAAIASGPKPPSEAVLQWRYLDGDEWFTENITAENHDAERHFSYTLAALPKSIRYRFEANGRESSDYTVTVARRPELTGVTATCQPPRYTRINPFTLTSDQDKWIVPDKSLITLAIQSDRALAAGYLLFADSTRSPITVVDSGGTAEFRLDGSQTVRVFVTDTAGLSNYDPVPVEIEAVPDLSPQIAFLKPGQDRDIPESMTIPMALALLDDYGFSKLEMIYHTVGENGESDERTQNLSLPADFGKEGVFEFAWSLLDARLFPGDRVIYRARVYDSETPKAKWAETETFALRLPTLDEIIAETERDQEERTDKVAEAVIQQQKMAEDLREMARQLAGKQKVEWENKQQLEEAMATQKKLAEQMKEWADDIEKEADKLAQNRMASLEMLQKMNEISRLMREVMTPEMEEMMKKLREAMEAMTPEEMRKALEENQMNQEQLMAQLDRALEQLRQLQLQQMMENLLRTAERLAEAQEKQNAATQNDPDRHVQDSLARQEEALQKELAELQAKAQELQEKNEEYGGRPEIKEFAQTVQECKAGADMQKMAQNLQQGKPSEAGEAGESASKQLRDMLGEMQQQMMSMQSQMNAEQMQKLRDLAAQTLEMSDEVETMGDSTGQCSAQSPKLHEMAAKQAAVAKGIEQLLQEFDAQAKQNLFIQPEIREALQQGQQLSDQATQSMLDRDGRSAQSFQYESMFSLNEAAEGLMESLDNQGQCQGQNPGQGKMHEGMQQLSEQQQQLNQQSQAMANPYGLSPSEQQAAKRLSAQQQAIQKQMRDLAGQYEQSRDRLGRLDEMAKTMDEVIEDMAQGEIHDQTLERQRNIYNRMLDFDKSLQRQDYENRRQSRAGTEVAHDSPGPLTAEEMGRKTDAARWEKFRNEWYPQRFRALVKDYFDAVSRNPSETESP